MSRKIFVGGLSRSTTEATLKNTFQRFGVIQNIKIVTEPNSRRSKGFAFITYQDEMAAQVAMSQMSGCQIEGRVIKVNHAYERSDSEENFNGAYDDSQRAFFGDEREDPTDNRRGGGRRRNQQRSRHGGHKKVSVDERIYVGGMDWNTSEDTVREAFEEFGDIDEVRIVYDKETGQSKGFGFVTFLDAVSADNAIEKMHGQELEGRILKVNKAQYRNRGQRSSSGNRSQQRSQPTTEDDH